VGAITHIATTTTGPNLGGIGAITVAVVNGVPKLYVGSEATSGMSVFTLSQTGATYQEQLGYAANRGTEGVCDLDFVTISGQSVLIPSGRFDDRLSLHKIDVDGGFNGLSILGADPALIGQLNHSVALQVAGKTFLVSSQYGQAGFQSYQIRDDLTLQPIKTWGDTAGTHVGDISAMAATMVDGRAYFFAASAMDAGVTCYWMGQWGNIKVRGSIGIDDGLPISAPSAIDTVTVAGTTYVILGSAGSSSLSLLRMNKWGGLFHEDTYLDSLDTRFQGVQAIKTFEVGNRGFVVVGGADDGISLFEVQPDGSLFHIESIADENNTTLQDVSQIEVVVIGSQIQLIVAGSETGFTQFSISLGNIANSKVGTDLGDTLTGSSVGDLIFGRDGDDTLYGLGGADRIIDGAGVDTMVGGSGADVFVFVDDGRLDSVTDFNLSQDRLDLSHFAYLYTLDQLEITQKAYGVLITFGDDRFRIESHDGHQLLISELTTDHFIFTM